MGEDSVYDAFSIFSSHWIRLEEILSRNMRDYSVRQDTWKKRVEFDF